MDDQQAWQRASAVAERNYRLLPAGTRSSLDGLIARIMGLKEELLGLALAAGSAAICRSCNGECCRKGKYHVSQLDLLAYLSVMTEAVVPDFSNTPFCPYGGTDGCLMAPRFRPLTCVIFNCELVEDRMGADDKIRFAAVERELRDTVGLAERLLGYRVARAALLSCGSQVV